MEIIRFNFEDLDSISIVYPSRLTVFLDNDKMVPNNPSYCTTWKFYANKVSVY